MVRNSFACAALASRASLQPCTALMPHRVVSFINVVECGTLPSIGIRGEPPPGDRVADLPTQAFVPQGRSGTSETSSAGRFPSASMPRPTRGSKNGTKNTGSSNSSSTLASSSGSRSTSAGSTASHKLTSPARVRSTATSPELISANEIMISSFGPQETVTRRAKTPVLQGKTLRLFQVEVARAGSRRTRPFH